MESLDPKLVDKLRKLKSLAERGVGGEKTNAESLLFKLARKHGLSVDELLLDEETKEYEFHVSGYGKYELFIQIYCMVLDTNSMSYARDSKRHRSYIRVKLTKLQYEEISHIYETLIPKMYEEFEITRSAFFSSHKLYPKTSRPSEDKMPTYDEMRLWEAISKRAGQMIPTAYRKTELLESK